MADVPFFARRRFMVAVSNSTFDHCNSQSSLAREPVPETDQNHRDITLGVPACLSGVNQLVDLTLCQMFA